MLLVVLSQLWKPQSLGTRLVLLISQKLDDGIIDSLQEL